MSTRKSSRFVAILRAGVVAGVAGGLAEIGWIALYAAATGTPTGPVARGIVQAVVPTWITSPWAAELGVVIHLILAIALGLGLAFALSTLFGRADIGFSGTTLVMLVLTAVWAINFLIVLPHLNPGFVHLLPYGITLLSKLLFGLAAATVLRADRVRRAWVFSR